MSNLQDHLLDVSSQEELKAFYEEHNYAVVNAKRPSGQPDALVCTMDIQLLEDYLEYVKTEAQNIGVDQVKIAVCFAQYPEDYSDPKFDEQYKGYQTVFLKAESAESSEDLDSILALNYFNLRPPY